MNLHEDGFMEADYRAALDKAAAEEGAYAQRFPTAESIAERTEAHLDALYLVLALDSKAAADWERFHHRLLERLLMARERDFADLIHLIDEDSPEVLEGHPELVEEVLRAARRGVRELDDTARETLAAFVRRHQKACSLILLRFLREEQRIAARRFLVFLLAQLGRDHTPLLISTARMGPWYFTRNLAIVLGVRCDERSLPYLKTLRDHEHGKVRVEALRALSKFGEEGYQAIAEFAQDVNRAPEEREIAQSVLARTPEAGG
jgi:hypothetical protein